MPMPFRVKLLVLLPVLTAGTAIAADTLLMPAENVKGNVRYMTGGIGFDEAEAMRQAASHYPLTIELAAKPSPRDAYPRDVYLSSVRVDIRDDQGQSLITTTTDGPILLASLPPGRYTINAEIRGVSQQKTVTVGNGAQQRLLFEFPVD